MNDKVWVFDDPDEKPAASKKEPESALKAGKNPALAFSLSIIIWGSGQFYNRRWKEGTLFFLLMLNFILYPALMVFFADSLKPLVKLLPVSRTMGFSVLVVIYFAGLCIWLFGARQAYGIAAQERKGRFEGVTKPLLPLFCSFLVPGWGQFLNGQVKKGFFYLLIALAGFFSAGTVLGIFLLWDRLEPSSLRRVLEWVLTGCLALSPIIIFFWMYGVYDALKVCLDDLKKESMRKRMEYAWNRVKLQGWRKTVLERLKLPVILGLFLALLVLVSFRHLQWDFYLKKIEGVRNELEAKQMTVIPRLIDETLKITRH